VSNPWPKMSDIIQGVVEFAAAQFSSSMIESAGRAAQKGQGVARAEVMTPTITLQVRCSPATSYHMPSCQATAPSIEAKLPKIGLCHTGSFRDGHRRFKHDNISVPSQAPAHLLDPLKCISRHFCDDQQPIECL
jgi:hypothetical protein